MWGKKKFRYTFLCFRRSLAEEDAQRVAVIAEAQVHNGRALVVAGRDLDVNGLDLLSQSIVGQVKEWLEAQIDEAFKEAGDDDPLAYLASSHPYNLYFTEPVEKTSSDFLQTVIDIYAKEVLGLQHVELLVEPQVKREPGFMTLEMPGLSRRPVTPRRRVPAG